MINPINLLSVLLLAVVFFRYKNKTKAFRFTSIAFICIFVLSVTDFFPEFLLHHLEKRYESYDEGPEKVLVNIQNILVLGSGHTIDPDLPSLGQLGSTALARLTEGIRIHESMPGSRLILSGYGGESEISQAQVMAKAAMELGVEQKDLALQSDPTNTAQEADYYLTKWGDKDPLILVTSASHMPRAMQIFRNRGLDPIAAPTFFYIKEDPAAGFDWHWFDYQNFHKVEVALHEYIGMMWERISVRSLQ